MINMNWASSLEIKAPGAELSSDEFYQDLFKGFWRACFYWVRGLRFLPLHGFIPRWTEKKPISPKRNKLVILKEHLWLPLKTWRLWKIALIYKLSNLNTLWYAHWCYAFQLDSCESVSVGVASQVMINCKILIWFPFPWFFKKQQQHAINCRRITIK